MGVSSGISVALVLMTSAGTAGDRVASMAEATHSISEAIALQSACPALTLDSGVIATALAKSGISFAPLMPDIKAQQPYHTMALSLLGVSKACQLALSLYGPNGSRAAGFLAQR